MFRNERAVRFVVMVTPEDLKGTSVFVSVPVSKFLVDMQVFIATMQLGISHEYFGHARSVIIYYGVRVLGL
jgi:hypothetical protein